MPYLKHSFRYLAIVALVGCAVGPDFHKPYAPQTEDFTTSPLHSTDKVETIVGGESQCFLKGHDIPGKWWTLFRSKPLNALIEQSLKNNHDLKAAQAALTAAHENVLAQNGAYYPQVGGGISGTRSKTSGQLSPTPNSGAFYFNLFTPQVSVSYVPDVFGLNKRTVESLKAQEEGQRFQLRATYLTLTSNIVVAALQEAALRGQIEATHKLIEINTKMVEALRRQFASGYSSRMDVAAQESQLAQVQAALPPLEKQLGLQRDLLIALSGGFPSQNLAERFELSAIQLPCELPLSIPSKLAEQRPDIRQAEENLHAACALVGVAAANRLPNITLTADAGASALTASRIFQGGAGMWDIGASVAQPIFQGGALLHKERAAKAAYQQAAEQYRSVVIVAFQNVADSLHALQQDTNALKAAVAAERAAKISLDLTSQQTQTGYANTLALLNAEQGYQQALINLVQAQANRYSDTASLFQALGGGWWNDPDIAKK